MTSSNDDETTQILEKLTCIRDATGRPAVMIGLFATFYIEESWKRPCREAVAELGDRYLEQFRKHLVWARGPKANRLHKVETGRVQPPGRWLPQYEDGEEWSFSFHSGEGGEDEDAAASFAVKALGSNDVEKGVGYFHVRLPLTWFGDHGGSLPEFVLPICKRLRPLSGYAGIGFLMPLTFEGCQESEALVVPLAQRFPGIEVDDPISHSIHLHKGIKGVNWLNILGERWIKEAGGMDYLRIRLDEPTFPFYSYDGGLMIQAGPRPDIGDATQDRWPRHYVTLAKVLKKIQATRYYKFWTGRSGMFDHATTGAWLFRFDGK
jgi:hypothetical protein